MLSSSQTRNSTWCSEPPQGCEIMNYIVAADTDIGISKKVNQDSICVKTADTSKGKAALVMVCDGMGGLSKGELASAEVIRSFSAWFDFQLAHELDNWNWDIAAKNVTARIKSLNAKIVAYGEKLKIQLGTTVTGMIIINDQYMSFHVGDTRLYKIAFSLSQLTEDHTFVNREIKRGNMTPEEALKDPRRNALIQCVGVTGGVDPEIKFGNIESGVNYLICSDGFRHVISEDEIYENLSPNAVTTKSSMQAKMRVLIELVKLRNEKDNISAAMFRAEL